MTGAALKIDTSAAQNSDIDVFCRQKQTYLEGEDPDLKLTLNPQRVNAQIILMKTIQIPTQKQAQHYSRKIGNGLQLNKKYDT